ncbi:MAG: energy-coupling factor transporter transmembrane protein EcfT [Coriobacteriales bacterium]|jgi:cobalt/nickel transport system permease protein|nr:energy-coupling factor transporter transmembrane protein EcfT [Coriobacteriales bacterium]
MENSLSPQGKLLAALIAVLGIVLAAPHTPFTAGAVFALVILLAIIVQVPVFKLLLRSLVVVPVAGMISLFYPLRFVASWHAVGIAEAYVNHWQGMVALILTPWLCVLVMMLLVMSTEQADLIYALGRLRLPRALLLLLSFMYRYVDVMRAQLQAAHRSLLSRAPALGPYRRVLLYGNLAGSMLIRAYDRGERIHAAMLSRGYTGVLPRLHEQRIHVADIALIAVSMLFSIALIGYH